MEKVMAAGSLRSLMVTTLASSARGVSSNPAPGIIFPNFITPNDGTLLRQHYIKSSEVFTHVDIILDVAGT